MRKISAATTLALLLALILGSTVVYAAYHWCMDDPVFHIDGKTVCVEPWLDGVDPADVVEGPVRVKMYVSKDVDAYFEDPGDGFEVEIIHKGNLDEDEAEVRVKVPTKGKFPVGVTVTIDDSDPELFEGWTNKWVKCEIDLGD